MLEETRKVLLLIFIAPLLGVLLSLYLPRPWKVPKLEWRYVLLDVGVLGLALCCVYCNYSASKFLHCSRAVVIRIFTPLVAVATYPPCKQG
jgi:drug/metabolite transporter (DMT)-like permease